MRPGWRPGLLRAPSPSRTATCLSAGEARAHPEPRRRRRHLREVSRGRGSPRKAGGRRGARFRGIRGRAGGARGGVGGAPALPSWRSRGMAYRGARRPIVAAARVRGGVRELRGTPAPQRGGGKGGSGVGGVLEVRKAAPHRVPQPWGMAAMRLSPSVAAPDLGRDSAPYFSAGRAGLGSSWRWHPPAPRPGCCRRAHGGGGVSASFGGGATLAASAPGQGTRERWAGGPRGEAPLVSPSPAAGVPGVWACLPRPVTPHWAASWSLPRAVRIVGMPLVWEVGIQSWTRGP